MTVGGHRGQICALAGKIRHDCTVIDLHGRTAHSCLIDFDGAILRWIQPETALSVADTYISYRSLGLGHSLHRRSKADRRGSQFEGLWEE